MSALVRSFDWSTTPIGPIDSWSPALRMIVPFLLANRFPLLLWWGPEYISIYNDAYRPVLGTKHPWALGRPVSEVWSETWNVLQPLIDTPFQGGPATWDDDLRLEIDRYGFVEETHFTVAYSPVPDDLAPNGVGGVLATVHEITQEVVSERRIVALRDLSARTSGAKSAKEACRIAAECLAGHPLDIPFAFLYLTDPDGGLARLAGATGAELGTDISPLTVDIGSPRADGWPLADAISMGATQTVQCLDDRFEVVPTGPWSTPPNTALVMPIPSSQPDQPEGLIVVGISSHLRLDENYHRFLELVRTQIATAIANARAHEAERRRAEMLAELDRAKTTFFSNVSHEFRTPLTLLLGPLEDLLAAEDRALPAEQREQLTIAHRNALRLLRLVNTLLDFSRVEAGRIQATFDQVDLPSLTADLASTFRSAIERAGLELVVDCPPLPEGFEAYVDREMWEKIVLNLVSNAFKHTFKGQISVSLHPLLERDCLELKVSDTGTGIPAGELPRIFERFYRVRSDKARTYEGTGIGLALVQEMVKLHGGSIEVESEPGQGTTFTVTVPAGAAHLPEDSIGVARSGVSTALGAAPFIEEALRWLPDDPGSSQSDSGSELLRADRSLIDGGARSDPRRQAKSARVLVADDNADMRDYISRLLGGQYAVQAVRDGEAALQAARANLPDLVLADVMMPRLDGFGLLQALRGDPKTRDIPILLLSARAGEEARVEGLEAGADDYLVKPFSARELIARVDGHIQLGRIRREKAEVEEMARQAAETERDRLNEMFLQAPALICVLRGPNHVYEMANPLYFEVVGRRDILGKPIRQALPELEGQPFFDLLDHVYATGEPYVGRQVPARLDRDGDGIPEQVYFDFVYQRIHGAPGQVDGVFVHGIDVTHQVRATERIRRLQELTVQLSRSLDVDEMLNTIARSAASLLELPVGAVFLLDPDEPDGDFSLVSAHGIEPGRAAGLRLPRHASLAGSAVDEDRTLAVDDVSKASGTALPELLTGEPTGSEIAAPITADSQPLGVVKAFSHTLHRFGADDAAVLDALAAAASVALTNARLYQQSQEALRERDAFMSEAAHDLKTPLTNIKGQAQLLQRQAAHINDPYIERIIAGLKNIDTVVTKLAAQVDELRDAAHRDLSQSARFHRGQADIVAVVRKAVAEQERAASLHRFEVITEFQQIIGPWDATQLTRVIDNLLANAVKYSPNGGDVTLEMIREIAVARTWAVLTVRDHGLGIPSSDLPHVFERFHRGANVVNQFAGTGIGLASAKQIVERLGGTIEVESQEGAGSIFTVRLPLDDFATATST